MVQPKLTQADYSKISQLVYQHSRIHLGDSKMELVSSRLGKRLREHGCSSYTEYCELLHGRHGAEEINHLIDAISTNHTFFFREKKHFEFLESTVFSDFNKDPAFRADGRFRCWSAAASTGEEPYSIAITLARHAEKNPSFRWSMECSDISSTALATAQAGIYPESRLDEMPLDIKRRYFQRGVGSQLGRLRVKSELRANMQWHLMNLFQDSYPFDSKFQVIFCRNVMIYFDRPSQEWLVNRLARMLLPGGYLKVGHSESLSGITHGLQTILPAVYRKVPK
jgi:chemotaxis protein methyltransferase CheR